ncbi:MAG: DUF1549 domain-containing protein, partial [Phycisphaerales bacterium]|nr:DUF1549 domain-containing protein [Phycisphaerales bacterium]
MCIALVGAGVSGTPDQVRYILSQHCFECHGPDAATRKASLRLDDPASFLGTNRREGEIVAPGDPAGSVVWQRITSTDPDDQMPPPNSRHQLDADERAAIRLWIEAGAPWRSHWAFEPPVRSALPRVDDAGWCSDPIDQHVLAAMEGQGLSPAPQADRATVLRRAAFDLTGLPPTQAQLDAFEADSTEDALATAIDVLLASPAYGEHMSASWLDLARYADSYGYQNDVHRRVWPWRDWVISAFNDNLPWDDFITWQLAGDLLPDATPEQQLATTFNRLHRQTNEGGSVEEEFRVEYVADRVNTYATAMLGMTAECARCHDHKFDPFSQREYFELFACFDDIDECGLYSHFTSAVPTPALDLPSADQAANIARLEAEVAGHVDAMAALRTARRAVFEAELHSAHAIEPPSPVAHYPLDDVASGTLANAIDGEQPGGVKFQPLSTAGAIGEAALLNGDDNLHFPNVAHVTRADPFTISLWIRPSKVHDRAVVIHRSKSWTDAGSQGWQLMIEDGRLSWSLIHFWPGDAISIHARAPLPVDQWTHVTAKHDGSATAGGLALYIDGRPVDVEIVQDALTRMITGGGPGHMTVGERFRDKGFAGGAVDDIKVFDR